MCGNRSRAAEFIVILYGAAMFSKAFVELAFGLPNVGLGLGGRLATTPPK